MTGTSRTSDGLTSRRRRVLYRARHRGTKEMDFVMGRFADAEIERLSEAELDVFEHLLEALDAELFEWVSGRAEPPPEYDTDLFHRLRAFHGLPARPVR